MLSHPADLAGALHRTEALLIRDVSRPLLDFPAAPEIERAIPATALSAREARLAAPL